MERGVVCSSMMTCHSLDLLLSRRRARGRQGWSLLIGSSTRPRRGTRRLLSWTREGGTETAFATSRLFVRGLLCDVRVIPSRRIIAPTGGSQCRVGCASTISAAMVMGRLLGGQNQKKGVDGGGEEGSEGEVRYEVRVQTDQFHHAHTPRPPFRHTKTKTLDVNAREPAVALGQAPSHPPKESQPSSSGSSASSDEALIGGLCAVLGRGPQILGWTRPLGTVRALQRVKSSTENRELGPLSHAHNGWLISARRGVRRSDWLGLAREHPTFACKQTTWR